MFQKLSKFLTTPSNLDNRTKVVLLLLGYFIFGFRIKSYTFLLYLLVFRGLNSDLRGIFDDILTLKCNITWTIYPVSVIFLQITDNFIFFPYIRIKILKIPNFGKTLEMLKVYPKTADLALLQNFDMIEKNWCQIRYQRPEINKVWLASEKVYFRCWPVLFVRCFS